MPTLRDPSQIKRAFIHCSASRPQDDYGIDDLRALHVAPKTRKVEYAGRYLKGKGWSDAGYHEVITRNGNVETGRLDTIQGAGASGHNEDSLHWCLIGGIDDEHRPDFNFTIPQILALISLINQKKREYPGLTFHGHREVTNKACPCFDVHSFTEGV